MSGEKKTIFVLYIVSKPIVGLISNENLIEQPTEFFCATKTFCCKSLKVQLCCHMPFTQVFCDFLRVLGVLINTNTVKCLVKYSFDLSVSLGAKPKLLKRFCQPGRLVQLTWLCCHYMT